MVGTDDELQMNPLLLQLSEKRKKRKEKTKTDQTDRKEEALAREGRGGPRRRAAVLVPPPPLRSDSCGAPYKAPRAMPASDISKRPRGMTVSSRFMPLRPSAHAP